MSSPVFPDEYQLEALHGSHLRTQFSSGNDQVDSWLKSSAFQQQKKHLSSTKVLLHLPDKLIAGYYTLATGQIDFADLPAAVAKKLPRRYLPIAKLAWLGIDQSFQKQGLGQRMLARALTDCYEASFTFSFLAVVVDCIDDDAVKFYSKLDFALLPGHQRKMYLSFQQLEAMLTSPL